MHRRWALATVSAVGALAAPLGAGCTGDLGGTTKQEVPGPPDVVPLDVPAHPEVISSTATCSALGPREELLSVSPEGHAWLIVPAAEGAETSSVRILDPFASVSSGGAMVETIEQIELAQLAYAQAWSEGDAALIANGGLWRLEDLARIELNAPDGFASPATFCGDPSDNGVLLSGGLVFEHRPDEQWWAWDTGLGGEGAPQQVVRFDGECQSSENLMWLTSADGTLFRVEPAEFSRPVKFDDLVDSAATEGLFAMLVSDRLWIGPDVWQSWIFSGPTPTGLAASDGHLWMVSGDQLLRFDGETYVEVSHAMEESIQSIAAHAGGVWLVGDETICHQATGPILRVDGLRPFLRSIELEYSFQVKASDDSALIAELDGEPIELVLDPETGWLSGEARLDEVGWHTIVLAAGATSPLADDPVPGESRRTVIVKRLPETERSWAADIAPIYEQTCAGSTCHRAGATDSPDLGSYEAWTSRAEEIRTRVVDAKTMPPPSSVGPDWGDDQIEIISEWLEGGMLP